MWMPWPIELKRRARAARILLVLALVVAAGNAAMAERLPIKAYTSSDGLGSSFVNQLMCDSSGFMWFCTRDGLSRFDGARFITYNVGNRSSPPGIESITETRGGTYWIGTTGGLYRFKRDVVSQPGATSGGRPTLNAEFIDDSRGFLFEDRRGNIWYGSGALYRLVEEDGKVSFQEVELNLPPVSNRDFSITTLAEAGDGSLWIETSWGMVRRLPDGRLIFYRTETSVAPSFRSFLLDDNGRVWYLRGLALYVLQPEPIESVADLGAITVRSLNPTYVLRAAAETAIRLPERAGEILRFAAGDFLAKYTGRQLYQTSDKHIWLTTNRELLEFDGRAFHRFTAAEGLPPAMAPMAEDSAGNLWIGGETVLIRLNRRGLTRYGEADGFHSPSIHAINEARDGTLYFADGDFYLTRFDGKQFTATRPALAANPIIWWTSRYAFLDSRNEWWILTSEKLYRFAAANLKRPLAIYTSRAGLKSDSMFQIYEDRFGDIWVSVQGTTAAEDNGLARFERSNNRFHTFTESEGFPPGKSVSSFAEDRQGNLWLGFYEGGLARYANSHFTIFNPADGLPEGVITDLLIDREGRLWMSSSSSGVGWVNDPGAKRPSFVLLTTDHGLASNNIRTITEDRLGNIYLGTVRGVDRISPDTDRIKHYSVSDGLAGDFVVDSYCDQSGALWFATTSGLSRLVPTADQSHAPPAIWLGGLRIAGVQQALPELGTNEIGEIELSHTQNNLQVDFFGTDVHAGETLRYQYMLEGADADWGAPSEQHSITLANLASGSYRLLVRAINSDGTVSVLPASVTFRILPPVWLRWWSLTAAGALAAAVIYAGYRYRVNRLLELERVRTHIATDLHDDIGASLSRMAVLSEVVKRQTLVDHQESADLLTEIADSARGLVDSMSDIVWSIDPRKDDLHQVVMRIRQFASDVLEARNIDWEFRAPEELGHIKLAPEQRRHLYLIFKEAINNVARHSRCESAWLDLSVGGGRLTAEIRDDGQGFTARPGDGPTANGRGGNGLKNMQARAAELGGHLDVVSSPGGGTRLSLALPLRDHSHKQGA